MLRFRHLSLARVVLSLAPVALSLAGCSSDEGGSGPRPSDEGNEQSNGVPVFQGSAPDGTMQMPNGDGSPAAPNSGGTSTSEVTPNMLAPGAEPSTSGETSGNVNPSDGEGGDAPQPPTDPTAPSATAPVASAGCGNANPPSGDLSIQVRGAAADYRISLPSGYDGTTPMPLVFAFHGRNRTHIELQTIDAGGIRSELEPRAVVAYLKSQGGPGWNFQEEVPVNVEFFDALHPQLLDSYCIDTSRVFAIGHSSGGYFSAILACRYGDLFRGIGSVAGAHQEDACTGDRVAGLFVHGVRDTVVSNAGGRELRDQFLGFNSCQQTTQPAAVSPCVAYDGCAEGFPVQWCEHDEPTYSDQNGPTNHGWPSFASRAIAQFFEALP